MCRMVRPKHTKEVESSSSEESRQDTLQQKIEQIRQKKSTMNRRAYKQQAEETKHEETLRNRR